MEETQHMISEMEEGLELFKIAQEIFDMYFPGVLCKEEETIENA